LSRTDRHSPYHDLVENLAGGGCIVCRLARRSVSRYLDSVSYESVTDPAVRDRLRAANGLCRRHGRQYLEETRDPLGLAIINRDVMNNLLRMLRSGALGGDSAPGALQRLLSRTGGRKMGKAPGDALAPTGECPACGVQGEAERRFAGTLAEYLAQPEVATAYEREGMLCISHFSMTLSLVTNAPTRELLKRRQLALMEPLERELAEYERKSDYRFRHEQLGSERDAPARSLDVLTGEY
jgi:hypothetical protein